MVEYFRTGRRPSMLFPRLPQIAAAFALLFVSLCASAQNGRTGNHGAQAGLNIRVNIVSVVMPPPPTEPNRLLASPVTYNIPGSKSNVDVTEETRPYSAPGSNGIGSQGTVLRTLTIVPR